MGVCINSVAIMGGGETGSVGRKAATTKLMNSVWRVNIGWLGIKATCVIKATVDTAPILLQILSLPLF